MTLKHISEFLPKKIYKLIDNEQGGLKENNIYLSKDEVKKDLAYFHSVDVSNTNKMTLDELLDVGNWELVEVDK